MKKTICSGIVAVSILGSLATCYAFDYRSEEAGFSVDADSVFLGKTIRESGIRDKYHFMIAGVEREDGTLMVPDVNAPFEEGDVVWVVGEKENVYQLVDQKNEKVQAG